MAGGDPIPIGLSHSVMRTSWWNGNGWYALRATKLFGGKVHILHLLHSRREPFGIYFGGDTPLGLEVESAVGPFSDEEVGKALGLPAQQT